MTCTPFDAVSWTSSLAHWRLVDLLDSTNSCLRSRQNVWVTVRDKWYIKMTTNNTGLV